MSVLPGKSQQNNRELKRAVPSCSKLTHLLKKSKPDDQPSTNKSFYDVTGKNI